MTWRVDYTTPDYQPPTPLDEPLEHDEHHDDEEQH